MNSTEHKGPLWTLHVEEGKRSLPATVARRHVQTRPSIWESRRLEDPEHLDPLAGQNRDKGAHGHTVRPRCKVRLRPLGPVSICQGHRRQGEIVSLLGGSSIQ